jgi:hypothetical protein
MTLALLNGPGLNCESQINHVNQQQASHPSWKSWNVLEFQPCPGIWAFCRKILENRQSYVVERTVIRERNLCNALGTVFLCNCYSYGIAACSFLCVLVSSESQNNSFIQLFPLTESSVMQMTVRISPACIISYFVVWFFVQPYSSCLLASQVEVIF